MSLADSKDACADLHLPSRGVAKPHPIIESTAGDNIIHSGQCPVGMIQMTMQHVPNHTICCFPDELEDSLNSMQRNWPADPGCDVPGPSREGGFKYAGTEKLASVLTNASCTNQPLLLIGCVMCFLFPGRDFVTEMQHGLIGFQIPNEHLSGI
jgi:hypothetical protein